jgi:hypothetical protein
MPLCSSLEILERANTDFTGSLSPRNGALFAFCLSL